MATRELPIGGPGASRGPRSDPPETMREAIQAAITDWVLDATAHGHVRFTLGEAGIACDDLADRIEQAVQRHQGGRQCL